MSLADLKQSVLDLIERKNGATLDQIRRNNLVRELADNDKQITNLIYNLKKFGHIVRRTDGRYTLVAPKGEPLSTHLSPPEEVPHMNSAIAAMKPTEPENTTETEIETEEWEPVCWYHEDRVREILEDQERVAQDALDKYLMSVGDEKIIAYLRAPRDAARAALEAMVDEGAE